MIVGLLVASTWCGLGILLRVLMQLVAPNLVSNGWRGLFLECALWPYTVYAFVRINQG